MDLGIDQVELTPLGNYQKFEKIEEIKNLPYLISQ